MVKKFIKILFVFVFLLSIIKPVSAQEKKVSIYFFWSKTCPHCGQEKVFLEKLAQKNPQIELKSLELDQSENIKLLQKASNVLQADTQSIPFTVIGDQYFVGYRDDRTTGKQIEKAVEDALTYGCSDILKSTAVTSPTPCLSDSSSRQTKTVPETIDLPILGKVKTKDVSLPFLTVIMGVLDGFNPCAMWALFFLISLLLGMKDRKRMWILGTAFIITSAFVYFLFMSAWLNFFLFLGFVVWVRIIIGLIALGAGVYNLREYFVNKNAVCKVTSSKKRQKIFAQIKDITQRKEFVFALIGIIVLAFAVNLVELICSAGLPAIYTQILTLSRLPNWQYYLYLLLYIFFFMFDDLFVFFVAMTTLRAVGIEGKYARFSRLIGGILMFIIGLLMLFKPEILMFG